MDLRAMFTDGFTPEARAAWSILDMRDGLPREFRDGHPWHELSRTEWEALQGARSIAVGLNTAAAEASFEITLRTVGRSRDRIQVPVPGRLAMGPRGKPRPEPHLGFDLLQIHRDAGSTLATTLSLLLPKDRLRTLWWPDAETTEQLRSSGLHRDVVLLEVRRGDRLLSFRLSDRVCGDGALRLVRPFDPAAEPVLIR